MGFLNTMESRISIQDAEINCKVFDNKALSIITTPYKNEIAIIGKSGNMSCIQSVFENIFFCVNEYLKYKDQLSVRCDFDSLNGTLTMQLFRLIKTLNAKNKEGKQVSIFWECGHDQDLLAAGEDLSTFCDFPLVFSHDRKEANFTIM
jgi:hypothetical protein